MPNTIFYIIQTDLDATPVAQVQNCHTLPPTNTKGAGEGGFFFACPKSSKIKNRQKSKIVKKN